MQPREACRSGGAESQPDAAAFARYLAVHAKEGEAILCPAALLVGDSVRLKLEENAK